MSHFSFKVSLGKLGKIDLEVTAPSPDLAGKVACRRASNYFKSEFGKSACLFESLTLDACKKLN
jgi:hypothetical protein